MSDQPGNAQKAFGHIAPALADYTDRVLFGEVWERPGLSPRDRSLITVASLIALYRTNEQRRTRLCQSLSACSMKTLEKSQSRH